jgi:hypothetical protein
LINESLHQLLSNYAWDKFIKVATTEAPSMKYPSLIYLLAIVGLSTHLVIAEQTSQGRKPFQPSWKSLDTRLLPA